jgi:acyl-CoA synthetase (AMP-forming)/AMP-acid ligase II
VSATTQIRRKFNTVVDAYRYYAEVQGNKIAYTYQDYRRAGIADEKSITFGELDRKARSLAAYLSDRGAEGERVILLFTSGIEYVEAYVGCLYAGAIPVPAYPPNASRFFAPRLHSMIPDSQASFALTRSEIREAVESKFSEFVTQYDLSWIATDILTDDNSDAWRMPSVGIDSIAFLQYTSGSTSTPKGVIVTHGNLLHNIGLIGGCFKPLLEDDRENLSGVVWLPPYHDMGLIGGILALPYYGITVHLMSPFAFMQQPYRWLEAVSRFHSKISAAPNFAFDYCTKNISAEQKSTLDLSDWKIVFNGAEPINPATLDEFAKAFAPCGFRKETFYPCYGLAESSLIASGGALDAVPIVKSFDKTGLEENKVVACAKNEKNSRDLVGCGTKLSDGQIRIVDPQTFSACAQNAVGEIWLTSPSIAKGYWNNRELTETTFQAYLADRGEGPFLRTGDLGFIYEQELYITGRLKDLIIINGKNINPNDIERSVEVLHPLFCKNSTAAFSIEVAGEEAVVVVQEVERKFLPEMSEDAGNAVKKTIKEMYDLFAHDIVFITRGSIRKTSSGKIQRRACKEDYSRNLLAVIR